MLRNIISGILMLTSIVFLHACSDDEEHSVIETGSENVITDAGRSIEIYDFLTLRDLLNSNNDTLYLFNFWATWCQPCVKELPYLDMIDSAYSNKAVRVILISLDFVENTKEVLIPFLNAKNIQAKVILLDERDGNSWNHEVDPTWDGAIPATLFRQRNNSNFRVHAFTYEELVQEVETFLNP